MPTTPTELLLFVILLLPGLVYVTIRERSTPSRERSAFRDTARVAMVSVIAAMTAVVAFSVIHSVLPELTPDIGRLIREGERYVEGHYRSLAAWFAGLLLVATAAAACVARRVRKRRSHPSVMSSWWYLMDEPLQAGKHVHVGCNLDDGSWIDGRLQSFNMAENETPDRDLVLREPITYRPPGGDEQPYDATAVCVSARRMVTMFVTIVEPKDETTIRSSEPASEASEAPA